MIKAIQANSSLRVAFKKNEDALTSSIFERLMYLPKELLHNIFKNALLQEISELNLMDIESIEFWPHWDPEETSNKNFVEPDVFIRTTSCDIIIEAKRYDYKQQDKNQWINEVKAYYNEYEADQKTLIFIALGGLFSKVAEKIEMEGVSVIAYKCQWRGFLNAVLAAKAQIDASSGLLNSVWAVNNVLEDLILCFRLFGYSIAPWFEQFFAPKNLTPTTIKKLKTTYAWIK